MTGTLHYLPAREDGVWQTKNFPYRFASIVLPWNRCCAHSHALACGKNIHLPIYSYPISVSLIVSLDVQSVQLKAFET